MRRTASINARRPAELRRTHSIRARGLWHPDLVCPTSDAGLAQETLPGQGLPSER